MGRPPSTDGWVAEGLTVLLLWVRDEEEEEDDEDKELCITGVLPELDGLE